MSDDKPDERPTIAGGIGEAEFNAWKRAPVTKAYLKYLADKADDAQAAAVGRWLGGKTSLAEADEFRGIVNTMRLAAQPDFEAVFSFYEDVKAMEQAEKEANDPDLAEIERAAADKPGPRRTGG